MSNETLGDVNIDGTQSDNVNVSKQETVLEVRLNWNQMYWKIT